MVGSVRDDTGASHVVAVVVQLGPDAINLNCLRAWPTSGMRKATSPCWPASRFVAWVERNLADNGNLQRAEALRQLGHQNRRSADDGA